MNRRRFLSALGLVPLGAPIVTAEVTSETLRQLRPIAPHQLELRHHRANYVIVPVSCDRDQANEGDWTDRVAEWRSAVMQTDIHSELVRRVKDPADIPKFERFYAMIDKRLGSKPVLGRRRVRKTRM